VARYSLSLLPSIASWLRWGHDPPAMEPGLLALAQPAGNGTAVPWREGALATGPGLGALPRAGEEVEAITHRWGHGSRQAAVGNDASERFLKSADLSRYGILHFATHAVVDPQHPERSAVVLAAGDHAEDGLLQPREIVRLPLRDKVVVLSACSGAAGQLVRGEGVMSLAHAFLQGGARAVVASRWPLADADALVLFERLYVHLDDGLSLADALARAQRDLHDAGAPAAAWAGVAVIGRGDVVLVPRPSWWSHRRWLAALGVLVALGIAARLARLRHAHAR
jgi:CHAT domain-containing protein